MIFSVYPTMDAMLDLSSDGESDNPKKGGSTSAAYEMIPLEDDFEPTSLDGKCAQSRLERGVLTLFLVSFTTDSTNSCARLLFPLHYIAVICARGKEAYNHPGNLRFRELVADNLHTYKSSTSKMAKSQIVRDIIESVRLASPRGGFVKKVDGKWWDVGKCCTYPSRGPS